MTYGNNRIFAVTKDNKIIYWDENTTSEQIKENIINTSEDPKNLVERFKDTIWSTEEKKEKPSIKHLWASTQFKEPAH